MNLGSLSPFLPQLVRNLWLYVGLFKLTAPDGKHSAEREAAGRIAVATPLLLIGGHGEAELLERLRVCLILSIPPDELPLNKLLSLSHSDSFLMGVELLPVLRWSLVTAWPWLGSLQSPRTSLPTS